MAVGSTVLTVVGSTEQASGSPTPVTAPVTTPGTDLAMPVQQVPVHSGVVSVSARYVVHDRVQGDHFRPDSDVLVRVSDGAVVREVPLTPGADRASLVDASLVDVVDGKDGRPRSLRVRDAETGSIETSRDLPDALVVRADDEWALTAHRVGDDRARVRFSRIDGDPSTDVLGEGDFDSRLLRWVGGDSDVAVLSDLHGTWTVDARTGAVTKMFNRGTHVVDVTDRFVLGERDLGNRLALVLVDRATGARQESPPVERSGRFVVVGEAVAFSSSSGDGPGLRRFDLASGNMGDVLVGAAGSIRPMGDGRVAITVRDSPTGRVLVGPGDDGTFRELPLPQLDERARHVALSDGRVYAVWGASTTTGVWSRATTTDTAWAHSFPAVRPSDSASPGLSAGGDVVLARAGSQGYTLSWPGGSRQLAATEAELSRDGSFVTRRTVSGLREVQEARTGARVRTLPQWPDRPVLDGRWIWGVPDRHGRLTGQDLRGELADEHVDLPASCAGKRADVRGRWVLAWCPDQTVVIDRAGRVEPRRVSGVLGNGFVASLQAAPDLGTGPNGRSGQRLQITDLVSGQQRWYGPVVDGSVVVDTGAAAGVAYLDNRLTIRHVDLSWVTPQADGDLQAPTGAMTSPPGPAATGPGAGTLGARWEFTDPASSWSASSGVEGTQVRSRSMPDGAWQQPAPWQSSNVAEVSVAVPVGTGTCIQARGRDHAGNVGAWTAEVCRIADGRAPTLTVDSQLPRRMAATSSGTIALPMQWSFSDGDSATEAISGLATYDVRSRALQSGEWSLPGHRTGLREPRVTWAAGPGDGACWSARARDAVGNVGDWSAERCTFVDGTAPVMRPPGGSPGVLPGPGARAVFTSTADDDDAVASYDVEVRHTPAGAGRGGWTPVLQGSPAGTWTSGVVAPGAEVCVRSRARDMVGHVSDLTPERCSVAPVDSTSLARSGAARVVADRAAIGGSYVRLQRRGAAVTTPVVSGRTLQVTVVRGPRHGATNVFAAGKRIGRIGYAGRVGRATVTMPLPASFSGRIRLVSTGRAPAQVDAVTVVR